MQDCCISSISIGDATVCTKLPNSCAKTAKCSAKILKPCTKPSVVCYYEFAECMENHTVMVGSIYYDALESVLLKNYHTLLCQISVICFTISQNAQNISTNICTQYNVLACSVLSHYKFYSDYRWRMLLLCFVRFGWWVLRPWVGPEFHICLASALTPAAYQNAAHLYGSPTLTHWGWSVIKMAAISQTTFANTFSWMRM